MAKLNFQHHYSSLQCCGNPKYIFYKKFKRTAFIWNRNRLWCYKCLYCSFKFISCILAKTLL